jgi:Ran GTPase-activating protein (RanGAP) involved in mRNA processing and transport
LVTNKTLKSLDLYANEIGDAGMKALGQALTRNDSLEELNIGLNKFGTAGLTSFASALKVNKGLKKLWLEGNSIGAEGAAIMAEALKANSSLTSVYLWCNRIGNDGAATLSEALKFNASLTVLGLSDNSIGEGGASSLLKALSGCNTTLTEVYLLDNDDISETIRSAIAAFAKANRHRIRLLHARAELDLSSKSIGAVQAKRVATELADNTTVTTLVLNKNGIGHQGCVDIADALNKYHVLVSIELNDNSFGDDGCLAMATTLRQNAVLTRISLNGNYIGPAGAVALAKMLQMNTSLRELGLGRNSIGNEGAAAIAGSLRHNETLDRLDLRSNRIGSRIGALAILKALTESNCSLTWLNLQGNFTISPGLKKVIGFMLMSRQVLKSFCKCLCKPLETKLMPLVVHHVQVNSICSKETELAHSQETMAGPIFLLVRTAALNDSKVFNVAPPSSRHHVEFFIEFGQPAISAIPTSSSSLECVISILSFVKRAIRPSGASPILYLGIL